MRPNSPASRFFGASNSFCLLSVLGLYRHRAEPRRCSGTNQGMYLATVGPALPMSLPNPYHRMTMAIGKAVNPPRIGGSNRRSGETAGGLGLAPLGSGIQPSCFCDSTGSSGACSDINQLRFFDDKSGAMAKKRLPLAKGSSHSITRFALSGTDSQSSKLVILLDTPIDE